MKPGLTEAVIIDGSNAESGGQIVRSALALSMITGRPVRLARLRLTRGPGGLTPSHLLAIRAAAQCSDARVGGAEPGASDFIFVPRAVRPLEFTLAAGASPVSLLLQTIALPLALAEGPSRIHLVGATHAPWAPTTDDLRTDWAPAMEACGVPVTLRVHRVGYHPEGGGDLLALIPGHGRPRPYVRPLRGNLRAIQGVAFVTGASRDVADRMAKLARRDLRRSGVAVRVDAEVRPSQGVGGGLHLVAVAEDGAETGFTAIGGPGKSPERIAREAVNDLFAWLDTGAAIGPWLADQILPALALADGPSHFSTSRITGHLRSTAEVVGRFLPVRIGIDGPDDGPGEVRVEPRTGAGVA